jgi:hypothetical protein
MFLKVNNINSKNIVNFCKSLEILLKLKLGSGYEI